MQGFTIERPGTAAPAGGHTAGRRNRVKHGRADEPLLTANGQAGGMGGGMPGMGGGGMGGNSMAAENQQDRKQTFLAARQKLRTIWLASRRPSPRRKSKPVGYSRRDDFPVNRSAGQIIGQVREAVYDSHRHAMPDSAGVRVLSAPTTGVTLGQQRALAVWRRIIYRMVLRSRLTTYGARTWAAMLGSATR